MPGIALQGNLPADGSAHGFDKNSDALDISHVNMAKYVEAADHVLNLAIATQPQAADGPEAADLAGESRRVRRACPHERRRRAAEEQAARPRISAGRRAGPSRPGSARADAARSATAAASACSATRTNRSARTSSSTSRSIRAGIASARRCGVSSGTKGKVLPAARHRGGAAVGGAADGRRPRRPASELCARLLRCAVARIAGA